MAYTYTAVESREKALALIDQFEKILKTTRNSIENQPDGKRVFLPEYEFPKCLI